MRDLTSFCINPFSDPRLSPATKQQFGEDCIQRMLGRNTNHQFDELLANTIELQKKLFAGMNNTSTSSAIRQARTHSLNNIVTAFVNRTRKLGNFLRYNDVHKQAVYQEFFPYGIEKYIRSLNRGNIDTRMKSLVTAIEDNTAIAGGPEVLTTFQELLNSYGTERKKQLSKMSEVSQGIIRRNEAEKNWDNQMFDNLLVFARLCKGRPQDLVLYMNQSILQPLQSAASDGRGRIIGTVRNNADGSPVRGVKVHAVDGKINDASTRADGSYTTQSLPVGRYMLRYSKEGFVTREILVEVVDRGDTKLEVETEAAG